MKTFKKLLAVILSVMMLLSVVVMPATAEDTVIAAEEVISKYISLLDLSSTTVGTKQTGVPANISDMESFNAANNISNNFTGNQEIVENADGTRSWKLYFDTATNNGTYLQNYSGNMVSVKFAIPVEYTRFVSGIKLDVTNGVVAGGENTGDKLRGQFGISDGTDYSAIAATAGTDIAEVGSAEGTSLVLEPNVNDLYKVLAADKLMGSEHKNLTDKWSYGTEFAYIYLVLTAQGCDGTEGSYALINDIGITVTGTEEEFAYHTPTTETYDLLNLDDMALGSVSTDNAFPAGVEEFKVNQANGSLWHNEYKGTKEVVENTDGSRGLKLDLSTVTFKSGITETSSTAKRIYEGGYRTGQSTGTIFTLKVAVPGDHLKLIDSINLKLDKQTSAAVVYAFGVTDGTYYSRASKYNNYLYTSDVTGTQTLSITGDEISTSQTYKGHYIGYDNSSAANDAARNSGVWADNEYSHIFLLLSAANVNSTNAGYVTINEISYTINATPAEYDEHKGLVTDFDTWIYKTANAVSGTGAFEFTPTDAYNNKYVYFTNTRISEASGISFWVKNSSDYATNWKLRVMGSDGSSYLIGDYMEIPAQSAKKIVVDFSDLNIDTAPTNPGADNTKGDAVSLTAEQKAVLNRFSVLCRTWDGNGDGTKDITVSVDDINLVFDESSTATLDLSAATGATVNNGKIEFVSSAEGSDLTATIEVPENFFRNADDIILDFDNATASEVNYAVTVFGTNDSGVAAHWKWGYKDWTGDAIPASTSGHTCQLSFAGVDEINNKFTIHEGTEDISTCKNCNPSEQVGWGGSSGHENNPPTPLEKASITTIEIRVLNNVGNGEKVVLNGITVTYPGKNTITANVVSYEEGGDLVLGGNKVATGENASFFVNVNEMYYVEKIEVLDHYGKAIDFALTTDTDYNYDYGFTFTMPEANVIVNVAFAPVTGSVFYDANYDGDNTVIDFTIPVYDEKVYNVDADAYQTLNDFGVIITSLEALAKYGVDGSELTPEMVAEYKESGHHLGNYIYTVDSSDMIVNDGIGSIVFGVEFTDITIRARRDNLAMVTYANFTDDTDVTTTVYESYENSIDGLVYGQNFVSEFYADRGINVSQVAQGDIDLTNTKVALAMNPAFWQEIRDYGFDHVRFPVKIENYIDDNGNLIESQMQKIDTMIDNALTAGLSLVFDVHGFKNLEGDYAGTCDEFQNAWVKLSERYASLPLSVAFEIINEPEINLEASDVNVDSMTLDELMVLQATALETIRSTAGNEERIVVITPEYNQVYDLEDIKGYDILNEENIIVDVHSYSPFAFSYAGVDWDETWYNEDGTLIYPEVDEYDITEHVEKMGIIEEFMNDTGVQCWIGEYGAYKPEATAEYRYIAEYNYYADEIGVARCMWELWNAWGPYNPTIDEWDENLIYAIMNSEDPNA